MKTFAILCVLPLLVGCSALTQPLVEDIRADESATAKGGPAPAMEAKVANVAGAAAPGMPAAPNGPPAMPQGAPRPAGQGG